MGDEWNRRGLADAWEQLTWLGRWLYELHLRLLAASVPRLLPPRRWWLLTSESPIIIGRAPRAFFIGCGVNEI